MEALKGGHILLQALEQLDPAIRRQVVVTFAGDGRERAAWEARAATLAGDCDIRFTGWLSPGERAEMLHASDLLVVPSLWPEPYGLVGPEAGAAGVPTLGFDVGGIREWLTDSVHGRLVAAGADPVRSLTVALADCLSDRTRLARWGAQAYADSRSRSLVAHVDALERVLESAAHGGARLPVPVSCEAAAARA
jgi:glycosyltransferase involved in cell wall biosynthesis